MVQPHAVHRAVTGEGHIVGISVCVEWVPAPVIHVLPHQVITEVKHSQLGIGIHKYVDG